MIGTLTWQDVLTHGRDVCCTLYNVQRYVIEHIISSALTPTVYNVSMC